jgi:hypothetical protein
MDKVLKSQTINILYYITVKKAVPLYAEVALGVRGGIAPTPTP